MKPRARLAFLVALGATLLSACGGSSDETTLIQPAAATVSVTSDSGSIFVTGDEDATEITIDTTRRWDVSAPEVKVEGDANAVTIFHECADGDEGCSVDYVLEVPEGTSIVVTSASGDVTVVGVTGAVTATSSSGDLTLTRIAGTLAATTTSGGILGINLTSPGGTVTTESGRIDISWEEPLEDLSVVSATGDITVQAPGQPYAVSAESPDGAVDVRIETDPADAKTITITSERGDVRVYAG